MDIAAAKRENENKVKAKSLKNIKLAKNTFLYIVLTICSAWMIFPFAWMILSSLKSESEIFTTPIKWIPDTLFWDNYVRAWTEVPFALYYWNTTKLVVITILVLLFTCSLAGYAFSKIKFPERDGIFLVYLSTMMIPYQVIMIPQFLIMKNIGLIDSHLSLILLGAVNPFGVFLFRQFFSSIPDEMLEAAKIDGLSEFGIYMKIVLPLMKPAIATLVIFSFMHTWNDFLGPLIYLTTDELFTLQLGMQRFIGQYNTEYGPLMAASVSSLIPTIVVYILAQDYFVKGIVGSSVKG